MKRIIENGKYNIITCSECGCKFSFDITDVENNMVTLIHNYIHQIDEQIAAQNRVVEDVKGNMIEVATGIVDEMFANGEIVITTNYNEETESLDLIGGTNGGAE